MLLSFPKVMELKQLLKSEYQLYLHFHDACDSQFFTFDVTPSDAAVAFLEQYFDKENVRVLWSSEYKRFHLETKSTAGKSLAES